MVTFVHQQQCRPRLLKYVHIYTLIFRSNVFLDWSMKQEKKSLKWVAEDLIEKGGQADKKVIFVR